MRINQWNARGVWLAAAIAVAPASALAQARTEITITDTGVSPESVTSSQDGSLFFGSTAKGTIYRAAPGATQADAWIQASTTGLTNVLGVLADDKASTLWVCANATGGRGGAPVSGQTALRSFDLTSGAPKGTYPFPNGGLCNDIAVASDGTAYAADTIGGRVLRLRPGASALEVFAADPLLGGADGIAILADGHIYVNSYFSGKLLRIAAGPNGTAGSIAEIATSSPFTRPDGLRPSGSNTLLQAEGQGRLTEITIAGDRGEVRVIRDGLTNATAVAQIGDTAFVLVERLKATAVPYPAK